MFMLILRFCYQRSQSFEFVLVSWSCEMSLFPAYSSSNSQKDIQETLNQAGPSWLENSSFIVPEKIEIPAVSSSESSDGEDRGKKCSKKQKHSKKKKKLKSERGETNEHNEPKMFYEDSKSLKNESEFAVPQIQLTKPARSYDVKKKIKKKKIKKMKFRYFYQKKLDEERSSIINPEPMDIQEFLKHTELFNQTLRNEPHNIKLWLDYVKLQDSGIGSIKGRAEKKLSILDRALEVNPDADELLHEKMYVTESIFPLDKVAAEAKGIIAKYPKNMIGWQWVINSLQFSLSKMAAPGVLINYEKALDGINKVHLDSDNFMDILLQCGLFLRQAGLWEQLWVLLELYLELNLTTAGSGAFKVIIEPPKDEIQQLEDNIITSRLPLGALWLRIERLREGIFFFPVEESSDPQRIVFREDLAQLLFPITRSCCSRLIMNTLLLLKIPPLPLSESFYRYTRLNKIPWSLDSVEILLATKFSKISAKEDYLDVILDLINGPQYLVDSLGQNQFFDYVNTIFDKCIQYSQADTTSLLVWQIRWWRWTYSIQKSKSIDLNDSLKKRFLNLAKKMLKQHRDCIPLYAEYALLEYEGGDFNTCLKVLETTMHLRSSPLMASTLEKRDLCSLYKVYIELLIKEDVNLYKEKILIGLIALAFGEPLKNIVPREDLLTKCNEKFSHITSEVLRDIVDSDVELSEIIFPDYTVSWLSSHAWFVLIHEGIKRSLEVIEQAISQLEKLAKNKDCKLINIMLEQLYESLVNILSHYCDSNPGHTSMLYDVLVRALLHFPNNGFFYNAIVNCEIVGIKWQKMCSQILSSGSALASTFVYFITHTRLLNGKSTVGNTRNRLQSLLEKLGNSYERCPLFWRLLLQASSTKDTEEIKQTFYRSVEKCPWVKLLYYEAAKILPEDLPEIQDLLVEKELRLHITPEELEILREGS